MIPAVALLVWIRTTYPARQNEHCVSIHAALGNGYPLRVTVKMQSGERDDLHAGEFKLAFAIQPSGEDYPCITKGIEN